MSEMNVEQLAQLTKLADEYASAKGWGLEDCLGSGGSAAVFKITQGANSRALKVYDPAFLSGSHAGPELHRIDLQRSIIGHECSYLVQIFEIELILSTCFIHMEFLPWCELSKCLDRVPRALIGHLLDQLVDAARFLESKGLVHRDIKPHNIMVSADFRQLKLIDLGVVRDISDGEDRTDATDHGLRRPFIATAQYSSPEYLFRTSAPSAELWRGLTFYQIGAVLHDLIVQRPLFFEEVETGNRYAVAMAVLSKIPALGDDPAIARQLRKLASHCLVKDLSRRLRFVTWEDFSSADDNAAARIRKKLSKLEVLGGADVISNQERQKRQLARREAFHRLGEALREQMLECFDGARVESLVTEADVECMIFRFHLLPSVYAVDMLIAADWGLDDEARNDADISASCCLIKADAEGAFGSSHLRRVTSMSISGVNAATAATALQGALLPAIEKAIDLVDEGGEIYIGPL